MASEPIPEPLPNPELDSGNEAHLPRRQPARLAAVDPERELPPANVNTKLQQAAGAVGAALGKTVEAARQVSQSSRSGQAISGNWKRTAAEKVEGIKQRASHIAGEVRENAAETYEQTRASLGRAYGHARNRTAEAFERGRLRARWIVDERPLQVIAAAAGMAFAAGVLLRIWRSRNHA